MHLRLKRIILFVMDIEAVTAFYRDVLGLHLKGAQHDAGWVEFETGACTLALHRGTSTLAPRRSPKIVFAASDVAATRAQLIARGAKLGAVKAFDDIQFCDGKDPEGNVFQISSRP
jgi:predicted enzyme related to lactoylglutathione lyase